MSAKSKPDFQIELAFYVDDEGHVQLGPGLRVAGMHFEECDCGDLVALVAFEIEHRNTCFVRARHLPGGVDVERAMRNFEAVLKDVVLNGQGVEIESAVRVFPAMARRSSFGDTDAEHVVLSRQEFDRDLAEARERYKDARQRRTDLHA